MLEGEGSGTRKLGSRICIECGGVFVPGPERADRRFCRACEGDRPAPPRREKPGRAAPSPEEPDGPNRTPGQQAPTPITAPGRILAGRYRILNNLRTTYLSQIYLAYDMVLSRKVVVKYLNFGDRAHLVERFRREATLLANLKHPNIVSVYDSGIESTHPYMVMEYIEGIDLEQFNHGLVQARDERNRIRRILEVAYELLFAIDYLHSQGIIHRDIKPSNILLDRMGRPFLIDFGIAKRDQRDTRSHTAEGAILGTLLYMSPEQAGGRSTIDRRSDIYAMGIMLYQLLTGKTPFEGATYDEIVSQILQVNPPPPRQVNPSLPEAVERVILKAVSKDPGRRYQGAKEMAQELEPVVLGPRPEVVDRTKGDLYGRYRVHIAVGLNAIAVGLLVFQMFTPWGGGGGNPSGGSLGNPEVVFSETFDGSVPPRGIEVHQGEVESRSGMLWVKEGRIVVGPEIAVRDHFHLTIGFAPGRSAFRELLIGLLVDPFAPGEQGWILRLHPGSRLGTWEKEGKVLARFYVPGWERLGGKIEILKRGADLTVRSDGRSIFELDGGFAGDETRPGRIMLQVGGGRAVLEDASLALRRAR